MWRMLDGPLSLPLPLLVGIFAIAAVATSMAGVALARSGDAIAEETGLGGLTVGMLLLAGATSLPEVVTDVSAALAGVPDIAIADLFGSSMANMAILALLDVLHGGKVWHSLLRGQLLLGGLAVLLTVIAVLATYLALDFRLGWIGPETVLIVVIYLIGARFIERQDASLHHAPGSPHSAVVRPEPGHVHPPFRRNLRRDAAWFAVATVVILVAAPALALSGAGIAEASGLGQTFVGAALIAASTSLPELVASLAAARIGAYDLAVGNLFGSNAFNMTIILAADIAYPGGPILAAVEPLQLVAGVGAIGLMLLALAGLARRRPMRGPEPLAIVVLVAYLVLLVLVGTGAGAAAG